MIINMIAAVLLAGFVFLGFYIPCKIQRAKRRKKKEMYRNLYVGQGSNIFKYGLNEYESKRSAEKHQKCPPGYRWHSAISSRLWV